MAKNPQGPTLIGPPDRVNDPTSAIIKLARAYTLSHHSFLTQPNIVMNASGSVVNGLIQAKRPGDANVNGYHYPYLVGYTPSSPPADGDRMVVHNSPSGPFIIGRLSPVSVAGVYTDPLTTIGDIVYRNGSNVTDRLGIGSAGQVLTVVSGIPAWQTPAFVNPMTTIGDIIYRNASNITDRLGVGSTGQVLTVSSGGLPSWQTPAAGFANPMTTIGDLISASTTATPATPSRIAAVAVGQVLISNGVATQPSWSGNLSLSGTLGVTGTTTLAGATATTFQASTSLQVASGTVITGFVIYTKTLSGVAVAANTTAAQSFAVTGLTTADKIMFVNKGTAQAGLGIVGHQVVIADTLLVTFSNNTGASITPTPNDTYKIGAIRS